MRVVKYMILAVFFLAALFFIVGWFFLPAEREVSREIRIDRPAKAVFKTINSMHNFNQWSPWAGVDTNASHKFSGPKQGIGSKMTWSGNEQVGSGTQEIVEIKENEWVKSKLYFEGYDNKPSYTILSMTPDGDGSHVKWTFKADLGDDVLARYYGMMMENELGPQYEKGLANLKQLVESKPVYDFSPASIETVKASNILYISASASGSPEKVSQNLGANYQQLMNLINEKNIQMNGPPLTITRNMSDKGWVYDAAIPVAIDSIDLDINSQIKLGQTYAGSVAKYIQKGPYTLAPESYKILNAYIEEMGKKPIGNSWEVYISDPQQVSEDEIITHLFQPIE